METNHWLVARKNNRLFGASSVDGLDVSLPPEPECSTVFEPLDNDRVSLIDFHERRGRRYLNVSIVTNNHHEHDLWDKSERQRCSHYTVARSGVNSTSTIVKGDVLCINKTCNVFIKVTEDWLYTIANKLNTSSL